MYKLLATDGFWEWLYNLKDGNAKERILARLRLVRMGHPGDTKGLGKGLIEMRIHTGKGYRVYYTIKGRTILLLLCGGNKSTQARDIRKARQLLLDSEQRGQPW